MQAKRAERSKLLFNALSQPLWRTPALQSAEIQVAYKQETAWQPQRKAGGAERIFQRDSGAPHKGAFPCPEPESANLGCSLGHDWLSPHFRPRRRREQHNPRLMVDVYD